VCREIFRANMSRRFRWGSLERPGEIENRDRLPISITLPVAV
jgi:hypothetical protein